MRLYRSFSLYSNKLFIEAVEKIQHARISEAIPLFEQVKQDPVCYGDLKNFTRVSEYLKGCYIATKDYKNLASVLEQLMFLNLEKPFQEVVYLGLLKDLTRCYIDARMYEKALFLLENYQNVLRKKYYTENFTNEMDLVRSTVYLLFDKYRESEKIILNLMKKEINNSIMGKSLNNLAICNILSGNNDPKDTIKKLKESLYQLELAKHVKTIDVPILEKDPSNVEKSVDFMSEERRIKLDREKIEKKGDYRTYKAYQHEAELKLLEKLNDIIQVEKPSLNELYDYKIINPQTLIVIGNLADVYKTSEDYNSSLYWNKYGLDTSHQHNISLYPRFAYSIYTIYNKIGNFNLAENFLISAISMAKISRSPYEQLAYVKYGNLLKENKRHYELYNFSKAYANKFLGQYVKNATYDIVTFDDIKTEDVLSTTAMRANYLIFEEYNTKIN